MNRTIDVFTTALSFTEDEIRNKTVVVIDVLRACSSIVTALDNGAKEVIPVEDMAAAGKIAQNLDATRYLLCGEKDGIKVDGYHLGNSPSEYVPEVIKGKTLIYSTSNGTKAITRAMAAKEVLLGCFLNLEAVVNHLKTTNNDIILICAGWKNRVSLEDMLCAGMIVASLYDNELPVNARDGAKLTFVLSQQFHHSVEEVLLSTNHATRLDELGVLDDVSYCAQTNITQTLPSVKEGAISNGHAQKKSTT